MVDFDFYGHVGVHTNIVAELGYSAVTFGCFGGTNSVYDVRIRFSITYLNDN